MCSDFVTRGAKDGAGSLHVCGPQGLFQKMASLRHIMAWTYPRLCVTEVIDLSCLCSLLAEWSDRLKRTNKLFILTLYCQSKQSFSLIMRTVRMTVMTVTMTMAVMMTARRKARRTTTPAVKLAQKTDYRHHQSQPSWHLHTRSHSLHMYRMQLLV